MTGKGYRFVIALLLLAATMLPTRAIASVSQQIEMELKESEIQDELIVTLHGKNLADVYAYELQLEFDSLRMQLNGAHTLIPGFTMDPIRTGNLILVALTKVGSAEGITGNAELFTLNFKRIRGGDANVTLTEAKLVNSSLKVTSLNPETRLVFKGLSQPTNLNDIKGHWAEDRIQLAVELGAVTGYDDGTFRPKKPITRAEFSVMLAKALQLPEETELPFVDVRQIPQWAASAIAAANQAGIISGYENGTFRAERPITRAELTVMLVRALGVTSETGVNMLFEDADMIPAWALPSVKNALDYGLLQGRGNNRFDPLSDATRAEAVTLILNLLHKKTGTIS